jgi:hypothetical protein
MKMLLACLQTFKKILIIEIQGKVFNSFVSFHSFFELNTHTHTLLILHYKYILSFCFVILFYLKFTLYILSHEFG